MAKLPELFSDLSSAMIEGISALSSSVIQGIMEKGKTHFEEKRQTQFLDFYRSLLSGTATKEKIEYEQMFQKTEEQYYALLNAAIEDEEREKASIYANIYRSILDEKIPQTKYRRLIRLAKELPYSAIEILAKIHIYQSYHTKGKDLNRYIKEIEQDYGYELNILTQNDIISSSSTLDNAIDIKKDFFQQIITVFFKEEDLLPQKYGIGIYSSSTMIFADSNSELSKEFSFLENLLQSINIRNLGRYNYMIKHKTMKLLMTDNSINEIVVLIDSTNISKYHDFLEEMTQANKKIVKVCFDKELQDPIPTYGENLIYLDLLNKESSSKFLLKFDVHPMDQFII